MAGKKYLARIGSQNQQVAATVASAGAANAGDIVALGPDGKLDTSLYVQSGGDGSRPVVASEAIGAGKFVNYFSNAGALNMRLADNSNNRPADGFVKVAVASAATGNVFDLDAVNNALTGLTVGASYYLGTAGGVLSTPLDGTTAAAGTIDQKLGKALSATELDTDDYDYVVL